MAGTDAKTAFEADGPLDHLKKALGGWAFNVTMDHHLVHGQPGNGINEYGRKTVTTGTGKIEPEIPCDRVGSFNPALIAKYKRRFPGFDAKIISMYARGMALKAQQHMQSPAAKPAAVVRELPQPRPQRSVVGPDTAVTDRAAIRPENAARHSPARPAPSSAPSVSPSHPTSPRRPPPDPPNRKAQADVVPKTAMRVVPY